MSFGVTFSSFFYIALTIGLCCSLSLSGAGSRVSRTGRALRLQWADAFEISSKSLSIVQDFLSALPVSTVDSLAVSLTY